MASALAGDPTSQVVDLLKQRKAGIKEDRRALDAEEKRVDRALGVLNGGTPQRGRPLKALAAGPAPTASGKPKAKAKRARRGGTRAEQAVTLITKAGEKGISASKIAKAMKIKPNYLYRVMGDLEKEGLVRKDGRMYYSV